MGKAYSEDQKIRVKALLEAGRSEDDIEKETGVSDRTIRRWKMDLERTGRIGKPPESRTGRHRVLSADVEAALCDHVKDHPEMSVDDMLWWLFDTHKIVVGTRTIRRVFERKDDKGKPKKKGSSGSGGGQEGVGRDDDIGDQGAGSGPMDTQLSLQHADQYQSPYGPLPTTQPPSAEQELAQALQQHAAQQPYPALMEVDAELSEDEETIQLQLQQIALQKREVELKLRMRRLQSGKGTPSASRKSTVSSAYSTPQSSTTTTSSLYNPDAATGPSPPKRDSRSKKKIEESKRRTAQRQERMLRDLERRSRRRDYLTAEWVASKDIWPLRAQGILADLMHQYVYYGFSANSSDTFEAIFRDLYQLVDLSKGDWMPHIHDELLRERTKRKMAQLRTKMVKTGEILPRSDGYAGFLKSADYTGEQAGASLAGPGDDPDLSVVGGIPPATVEEMQVQAQNGTQVLQHQEDQAQQAQQQQQQSHPSQHHPAHSHHSYDPVPDPSDPLQAANLPYAHHHHQHHHHHNPHHTHSLLDPNAPPQYPIMNAHHPAMLQYTGIDEQQGGMVM